MTDRDNLYIAGLLHDIGKFIERGKLPDFKNLAKKFVDSGQASQNYAHKRYSAAFIDMFKSKKDFLNDAVESLTLWHHRGDDKTKEDYESINNKGVFLKLLRIADDSASSERTINKDLEPVEYNLAKILSPFRDINIESENMLKENFYHKTDKLNLEYIFPDNTKTSDTNKYTQLVSDFTKDFENITDEDSLLYILEKYLTNVPAQTPVEIKGDLKLNSPDINLFDHSRVTAAIALCLYDEYINGSWKKHDKEILSDKYKAELDKPCVLINGNINGIQKFIFDIKSEKASKQLKGRSFFVQVLSDIVVKLITDKYNLKQANILYSGGGNFFILAPAYVSKSFNEEIINCVSETLMNFDLYISFGMTDVSLDDFSSFGKKFKEATESAGLSKFRKFQGLDAEKIFSPVNQFKKESLDFDELTNTLQKSLSYFYGTYVESEKHSIWEKVINDLGYKADFLHEKGGIATESIVLNRIDFEKDFKGYRFVVKDLPKWDNTLLKKLGENIENYNLEGITEEERPGNVISFERLANFSKIENGTNKLGILKMDVDNLGKIFSKGLSENMQAISRISNISRNLKFFFEGYVNKIISEDEFRNYIYVIFSGGDDFFVVGSWHKVFVFAERVYKDFRKFTCENKDITLSGALIVQDSKYPVYRFAQMAESRLHKAKSNKTKDSISVFDIVLRWEDFFKSRELKDKIVRVIKLTEGNRAIISKINKSVKGFDKIQESAEKGTLEMSKVWRLSYYLRDILHSKNKSESYTEAKRIIDNEIIKLYEKLIFESLTGKTTNINIFPVAARWAEFESKN